MDAFDKPLQLKASITPEEYNLFKKKAKSLGMTVQGRLALLIKQDTKVDSIDENGDSSTHESQNP